MAQRLINIGTGPNTKDGDTIRNAFDKVNQNFGELYTAVGQDTDGFIVTDIKGSVFGNDSTAIIDANNGNISGNAVIGITVKGGAIELSGNSISTTDSTAITVDQEITFNSRVNVSDHVYPLRDNTYDLGSPDKQWKSLYVSGNTIYIAGTPLSIDEETNQLKVNNIPISQTILYEDIPNVPTDIADLTDTQNLLDRGGSSDSLTSNNDINITINNDDSSSYTWNFGNTGDLTLPGAAIAGRVGGSRFIQDCADGTTSMRWINLNQGDDNIQLIRAYTGDPDLDNDVERAQINVDFTGANDEFSGITIRSFDTGDTPTSHRWRFRGDGVLQLPSGGDIVNNSGQSVLGSGSGLPTVTVPANDGTTYKGLHVSYGLVHSNDNLDELSVNKIVIHEPGPTAITIDDDNGESDDFEVTGLADSNIVAMFIVYGDTNAPKPLSRLKAFAEAVIDNVILNEGVEGQYLGIEAMRGAFYSNYEMLSDEIGGLAPGFEFYLDDFQLEDGTMTSGATTVRQGSGATFDFVIAGDGSITNPVTVANGGTNYLVGHKIKIPYTLIGGADANSDIILTVTGATDGVITSVAAGFFGGGAGSPNNYWSAIGTNYQTGSGFIFSSLYRRPSTGQVDGDNTLSRGTGYVVGDVITLPGTAVKDGTTPANDITAIVTTVGEFGNVEGYTTTGTLPEAWPVDHIDDGGEDQYDGANYINFGDNEDIIYNDGEILADSEVTGGTGTAYCVVYNNSIFGVLVTGSIDSIGTSGNSGADDDSITETGNLYGPRVAEQTFDNAVTHINFVAPDSIYAGEAVTFTRPNGEDDTIDILIADSGVGALEDIYLEREQIWVDSRNIDAADIAPATRPWDGMSSIAAYPVFINAGVQTPPAPSNFAPLLNSANQAYLAWQEALAEFGPARGVAIARASNQQGIFNPYREDNWNSNNSPDGTLWNTDGWTDLSDVESRTYRNLYAAFGFGGLGNKIIGAECVMYLPDNGKYYTVKFSSWTQGGNGGGFAYTRRELDLEKLPQGIRFADGTRLTSAAGVGRVKSRASNDRRIEEVSGSNTVTVLSKETSTIQAVTSRAGSNTSDVWIDNTATSIDNVIDNPELFSNAYNFEFSLDNTNWYPYAGSYASSGTERGYGVQFPTAVTYNQGATIYFRYTTGGDSVVWWDKNDLPSGGANFRGAVIDYHAYTGESTIIGTIHIVDDDGEEHITHTEVSSGSDDGMNDNLWIVTSEGRIRYGRFDGEEKRLKIHWTAKVFYGSELYD